MDFVGDIFHLPKKSANVVTSANVVETISRPDISCSYFLTNIHRFQFGKEKKIIHS